MRSKSRFRQYSESGIVHRLEQPMLNCYTPSMGLSVVYATEGVSSRRFFRVKPTSGLMGFNDGSRRPAIGYRSYQECMVTASGPTWRYPDRSS
jgi:hypothetical protein